MTCKFEHDGDCWNCGSTQYMHKCKPDVCNRIVPIRNVDCIRAMNDDELANQLIIEVEGLEERILFLSAPTGRFFIDRKAAVEVTLEWLKQPAEEDDH